MHDEGTDGVGGRECGARGCLGHGDYRPVETDEGTTGFRLVDTVHGYLDTASIPRTGTVGLMPNPGIKSDSASRCR